MGPKSATAWMIISLILQHSRLVNEIIIKYLIANNLITVHSKHYIYIVYLNIYKFKFKSDLFVSINFGELMILRFASVSL